MPSANESLKDCLAAGVQEFIVCGGARNAPLVAALVENEALQVWRHFEERSTAFFALGRTRATGQPCAVVVTSGTALAECLPAVIEAHYQARPLVIISADRPEAFRGSGSPQAIEQENIFSSYAHNGNANEWCGHQPWHLNLPLEEDETLSQSLEFGLYQPQKENYDVGELLEFLRTGIFKGVIAMVGGLESEEREEAYHFLKNLGVPVVADTTSGIRESLGSQVMVAADHYLKKNPPGKILRLGDVPTGRFWRDLEDLSQVEVFSITRNGLPGLARSSQVIKGAVDRILRGLGEVEKIGDVRDDLSSTKKIVNGIDELLEAYPDSEPGLIRTLSLYATTGESLFLGNSLPIREWNDYAQRELPYPEIHANRGANGIDGQLSTWLGATASDTEAWGIFGDLTTLYDLSAPALLNQVYQQGRTLVVINNNGGRIFEKLPRLDAYSEASREAIIQPQGVDFQHWAKMWGMNYHLVTTREEIDEFQDVEACTLVEIQPSQSQTENFEQALQRLF
nr:2-succinyl-5-enolpyruvyl-6-hydroxy-3-cyclohexene-1-carboxylate synthase-like [Nerophis lumbriciformis]